MGNANVNRNGVDLDFFNRKVEELGYEENIQQFIFECCEGDLFFGSGYQFKNECPNWRLKREDEKEYNRLRGLYAKERENEYTEYVNNIEESFGYKHLQQDGGGAGGSEHCYGVFQLGDKIYKAEYSYYSHQGHEIDYIVESLQEVKPQEKTIIVYV